MYWERDWPWSLQDAEKLQLLRKVRFPAGSLAHSHSSEAS
jgi:hypothetical protein